ncbi:MAG: 3'-5' exonuclease, partial [Candidatus Pacebacteria bacterium]|nr:3'-5' exonuclease [Candidatus Paceibacterota bacterium]
MVPSSDRKTKSNYHYVYLMFRSDIGWRIGKTDNVIGRLRLERSADNIIALKAFNSDSEARYYETLWSLKYGIPTSCFCKRKGTIIKDDLLNKLYQEIDVMGGVSRMAKDLNIDLNYSHYYLDAVNRGNKERIKIIIQLCYRSGRTKNLKDFIKKPLVSHVLRIETSASGVIEKIERAGFKMRKAKKGKRFVFTSSDIREIGKKAKEIQELIGGFIEFRFYAGLGYDVKNKIRKSNPSIVIPAKNLVRGHYLPIKRDNDVVYDEIIDIKTESKKDYVYDLEIEKTHNFLAQGIIVHNSIFSFQGSSFNNVLRFKKDYSESKEVVLTDNYRSPQNILDLSYSFIQHNNPNRLEYQLNDVEELRKRAKEKGVDLSKIKKIDKKLKSQKKKDGMIGVLAYETGDDELKGIISKIWEIKEIDKKAKFSDFVILTRTNESANNFSRAMERSGIPYQFLSSKGLYTHPLILDFISYFNLLMNFYDSASFYRVLRMYPFDFSVDELAKITYYAEEKGLPISETLNQIQLLNTLSKESREKVSKLLLNIKNHFKISKEKNVGEVFVSMVNDLGYVGEFSDNNEETFKMWDIVDQFYHRIKEFEDSHFDAKLVSFMEHIQMEMEAGEEGSLKFDLEDSFDSVKIMTIHSAKGLEFDYVFLVNLVHRKFPSDERKEPIEIPIELIKEVLPEGDFHLQEERRLFYVALTRARKGLFLAWALDYGGKTLKKPSRFLIESNLIHEEALSKQKFSRSSSFCSSKGANNGFKKESKETEITDGIKEYLPDHFSFSQIASFNNCPLQYKFSHIIKIPSKGRPNFSFGKTIHNTLYHFAKIVFKGKNT